jgi:prevent-host-death family protein
MEIVYGAADFKAHCLQIMEEVATSKRPVKVTKRGKMSVRIVPDEVAEPLPAYGFLKDTVSGADQLLSTGETWDAD